MKILKGNILVMSSVIVAFALCGCSAGKEEEPPKREEIHPVEEYAALKGIKLTQETETTEENKSNDKLHGNSDMNAKTNIPAVTGNILIDAGEKTKRVGAGMMAYIEITKEELRNVSQEDFKAFAETKVKGCGYNWISVMCEDGTGIQFTGGTYTIAIYGDIDCDGCVESPAGYIWLNDGAFIYEE